MNIVFSLAIIYKIYEFFHSKMKFWLQFLLPFSKEVDFVNIKKRDSHMEVSFKIN